jgi:hypothetical protein
MFSVLYLPGFARIDQAGEHFSSLSGQLVTAALTVYRCDAQFNRDHSGYCINQHWRIATVQSTGTFCDGSLLGISGGSAWSSTNVNIATVARELAASASAGKTTTTATMNGASGTAILTIQ